MNITKRNLARTLVAATALTLLASACGSDTKKSEPTPAATAVATTVATTHSTDHGSMPMTTDGAQTPVDTPVSGVIAVTAADYKFSGIPSKIAPGSKLTFTNSSSKEFHEMVVIRLPDSETRTVPELLALGPEKLEQMFGQAEPAAVLLGPPGGAPQIEAVGDGTLSQPGRYMFVCTIPVGADPAEIAKAMSSAQDGPPSSMPDGPPHFTAGMWAEAVVG